MRYWIPLAALVLLAASCGGTATVTTTAPPAPTATPSTTTTTGAPAPTTTLAVTTSPFPTARLESYVASWSDAAELGIVLAVLPSGGEPQVFAGGFADVEARTPLEPDDVFYVGSITKTVVATVVMQLVEEGRIDLDATVDTYLPELLAGEAVTVRHLLSHQSGVFNITEYPALQLGLFADPFQEVTPEEATAIALEQNRAFAPGEQFSYSNTNYLLAGMIIEAVTGTSLAAELEARVFAPLGLDDARLAGEPGRAVVNGYSDFDGDFQDDATEPYLDSTLYTVAWGAGGLAATAEEVARFASAAFNGDLLSESSVETMTSVTGSDTGYALGVGIGDLGGETVWGHGGAIPGYLSQLYYFPEDGLTMVAVSNTDGALVDSFLQAAAGIVRDG